MELKHKISKLEDVLKLQTMLGQLIPRLAESKTFECTIKPYREKRSLNANDYSWKLQNEIAKALNRPIDDLHNEMVLQYGVLETYSILKDTFDSAKRAFDYFKILGESKMNDKVFIHVRVGLGTHTYTTKEMATFIDGVVQEAKNLDIETRTPSELEALKGRWAR